MRVETAGTPGILPGLTAVRTLAMSDAFEIIEVRDGRGRSFARKRLTRGGAAREDLVLRLRHEGDVLETAAGCPNVIGLVSRQLSGWPELLLEFADGGDLSACLARSGGTLPAGEVRRLGLQLCTALEAIHARGIIHRDVKPSNLLLLRGDLHLADFGVAATGNPPRAMPEGWVEDAVGTEPYRAPEQRDPRGVIAPAADIYGAGVTLAELLGSGPAADMGSRRWLRHAFEPGAQDRPSAQELRELIARNL